MSSKDVRFNSNIYLEMCHVALQIIKSFLKAERINNVVDGFGTILESFLGLLRGRVGT
jgi:hypothetical protein